MDWDFAHSSSRFYVLFLSAAEGSSVLVRDLDERNRAGKVNVADMQLDDLPQPGSGDKGNQRNPEVCVTDDLRAYVVPTRYRLAPSENGR